MRFLSLQLLMAAASFTAMAFPSNTVDTTDCSPEDWVELYREPSTVGNGTLIYSGCPPDYKLRLNQRTLGTVHATQSCKLGTDPTLQPKCDTKENKARRINCDKLLEKYIHRDLDYPVDDSKWRQLCWLGMEEDNSSCCVSWHKRVPGLTRRDLSAAAQKGEYPLTTTYWTG